MYLPPLSLNTCSWSYRQASTGGAQSAIAAISVKNHSTRQSEVFAPPLGSFQRFLLAQFFDRKILALSRRNRRSIHTQFPNVRDIIAPIQMHPSHVSVRGETTRTLTVRLEQLPMSQEVGDIVVLAILIGVLDGFMRLQAPSELAFQNNLVESCGRSLHCNGVR